MWSEAWKFEELAYKQVLGWGDNSFVRRSRKISRYENSKPGDTATCSEIYSSEVKNVKWIQINFMYILFFTRWWKENETGWQQILAYYHALNTEQISICSHKLTHGLLNLHPATTILYMKNI